MKKDDYQKILADLRTMSAIKRNHLAEERTALAELRTGLAILVISPSILTVFTFFISNLFIEILNIAFFVVLTIIGIWLTLHARNWLKNIRKKKIQIVKSMDQLMGEDLEIQKRYSQLISEYNGDILN